MTLWQKNTDENAQVGKSWENLCQRAETELQKIQKEYKEDREQRRILLLLAANAELQKEWERSGIL